MKKLVFITCLFFISSASFAQRVVDLSISMTSPANGGSITGTQSFNFSGTITNNGPDTLKTSDTLVFGFTIDNASSFSDVVVNGQTYPQLASVLQQNMAPGVSGTFNFSMALATAPPSGPHSFCVTTIPFNRSADSVKDNNSANSQSCSNITVQPSASVPNVTMNGSGIVERIYPNPAGAEATIGLNLPAAGNVSVTLTDLSGRIVRTDDKGRIPGGRSELHIDTGNLPAGVYLYQLTAGNDVARGRLVVAH